MSQFLAILRMVRVHGSHMKQRPGIETGRRVVLILKWPEIEIGTFIYTFF